jgi:hypothetical protein
MITGQPCGIEGLATTSSTGIFRIAHLGLAKLAVITGTAAILVSLYIGTKHFLSIEDAGGEQTRTYSLDISESCLNGAEAPVLEAREGDRIVLKVTSLYPGDLYLHGLETETNLVPGSETSITFIAAPAGRYYLHLHGQDEDHAHAEVAILEIAPR